MWKQRMAFFIPDRPVPQARARVRWDGSRPHLYTEPKSACWQASVGLYSSRAAAAVGLEKPIRSAVWVSLDFFLPSPKSKKRSVADWAPRAGGDLDNLVKAILDGMRKIVYVDDRQVVGLLARKLYTSPLAGHEDPGVEVKVEEWLMK